MADTFDILRALVDRVTCKRGWLFYLNNEDDALDGNLWWDCYPGCRVFATRDDALKARMQDIR